jgi:hypothetical protein
MQPAFIVITNPDLFKHIQSFRAGFTRKQHIALQVIRKWIMRYLEKKRFIDYDSPVARFFVSVYPIDEYRDYIIQMLGHFGAA